MTRLSQLEDVIAGDLAKRSREALTMQDVTRAMAGLSQQQRLDFLEAIRQEHSARAGSIIVLAVRASLRTSAQTRAAEILTDGAISVAELNEWLEE